MKAPCLPGKIQWKLPVHQIKYNESSLFTVQNTMKTPCLPGKLQWKLAVYQVKYNKGSLLTR
jgi:hypothetical protein